MTDAAVELLLAQRAKQGLPRTIEDPEVLSRIAGVLVRGSSKPTTTRNEATTMSMNGRSTVTPPTAERHSIEADLGLPELTPIGYGLAVVVAYITAEMAQAWLSERHPKNRSVKLSVVDKYARALIAGNWLLNGETIIFDHDGQLKNGQHRLRAIVKCGMPMLTVIIVGVGGEGADDVMKSIDTGKPRSGSDIVGMAGVANSAWASAMASIVVRWEKGLPWSTPITAIEQLDCLDRHPALVDHIPLARRSKATFGGFPHGALGALHYLFSLYSAEDADDFSNRLIDGLDLKDGDPILTLRNTAIRNQKSSASLPAVTMYVYIIKAWNFTRRGESLKILKWLDSEDIPEIYGVPRPRLAEMLAEQ